MFWFLIILVAIICMVLSGHVAQEKGYDGVGWGIAGIFFGPFVLIAAAGLPDRKLRASIRSMAENQAASSNKP
jgi:hypothetical protein